jgi:hypothetical protein
MNNRAGRQCFADNLMIVKWPQRRLGTGQFSLLPANALVGMHRLVVVVLHGSSSSAAKEEGHACAEVADIT